MTKTRVIELLKASIEDFAYTIASADIRSGRGEMTAKEWCIISSAAHDRYYGALYLALDILGYRNEWGNINAKGDKFIAQMDDYLSNCVADRLKKLA